MDRHTLGEFKVLFDDSEQLHHSVPPRLSLLLAAEAGQRLSAVHQGQHRPLKVLLPQRLPAPRELCCQTAYVREALGKDVVADDLQLVHAPQGGQLLIWDQHDARRILDLHSS